MDRPVFRFAPSPTGEMHIGHALSAILNFEMAREVGGRFLLRIEDTDVTRCRPEFEALIYEDLAWLGLEWEEPVRRQSGHFSDYERALNRLNNEDLLYPSAVSRKEIAQAVQRRETESGKPWPRDPDGSPLFPFSRLEMEAANAVGSRQNGQQNRRLDMTAAVGKVARPLNWRETGNGPDGETGVVTADPTVWGDVVLARKDTPTSYHLSVVVDDALQEVTDVVRGHDVFWATSIHRLLQELLDLPAPRYHHHRLILDASGRKLSKSNRDVSLRELRDNGASPGDIRKMTGLG